MQDTSTVRLALTRGDFAMKVDLALPARGITAVFGPSGSGKTTLLRCVAGLERAGDALVRIGGAVWQDDARRIFVPTWRRPLGYVFQEASLFEHLDVRGNLQYGLRRSGGAGPAIALEAAIELLGIGAGRGGRRRLLGGLDPGQEPRAVEDDGLELRAVRALELHQHVDLDGVRRALGGARHLVLHD